MFKEVIRRDPGARARMVNGKCTWRRVGVTQESDGSHGEMEHDDVVGSKRRGAICALVGTRRSPE